MSKVISIMNQKGGVGKTTLSGNIAYEFAQSGYKTLLIDGDPQGSLSLWLADNNFKYELYDALIGTVGLEEAIIDLGNNLDLLPTKSNQNNLRDFAETKLLNDPYIFAEVNDFLKTLGYDIIIYDTSPSSSFLEKYILAHTDEIYIVTKPEFFSVEGLENIINFFEQTIKKFRSSSKITKIIINEIDKCIKLHKNYSEYLFDNYKEVDIFRIYKNVNFKYSQDNGIFYKNITKNLEEDFNANEIKKIVGA